WGVRKQLLDDLYIRFFRLAEKRIAEANGRGIVAYISNYSWLDGLSHPVMREHIVTKFDRIWIDNCNGDKYKTGKRTPAGKPDESMFTTDDHRIGIQVGTAITMLVKTGRQRAQGTGVVLRRDLWGTSNAKRGVLLDSLRNNGVNQVLYQSVNPNRTSRWIFAAGTANLTSYDVWPTLPELLPVHYSGLNENRQGALISQSRDTLQRRFRSYFDRN